MPQIIGSGGAIIDLDGDGRRGLLLLQNGGPKSTSKNRLFRQSPDGNFVDVSAGSGLDYAGHCMGAVVGDVDNDGLPDVLVTEYLGARLFRSQGKGKFEDVTKRAKLDHPGWATAASFFDYDRDGWLDLIIVNYVDLNPTHACSNSRGLRDYCHPNTFGGMVTRLYRNMGADADGKWQGFEDRTETAGLGQRPGAGLGVLCIDFNGDNWPDIFVANDARANHLWINQKNGTFAEEAVSRGVAFNSRGESQGNMGTAFGDSDGDGWTDLFVTHLTSEHPALWRQGPCGLFQDRTSAAGLTASAWRGTGFGAVFADFDNDGDLDLAVVNGRVARPGAPTQPYWQAYAERNQLFINGGAGKFEDISSQNNAFCGEPNVARGLMYADFDGDGGLDLAITQIGGPAKILRNTASKNGCWLAVRAIDGRVRRDAIGAEITVHAGKLAFRRIVQPSSSYLGSNDSVAHFGLGSADRVDRIDVVWPDGSAEAFPGVVANRMLELRSGNGVPVAIAPGSAKK